MRPKVGLDLAPIGFRQRAPGTAVHVENQARALLAQTVEWEWVLVATPRTLSDSPFFGRFNPIVVPDGPLSYHVSWHVGRVWRRERCALGMATAYFTPLLGPPVVTNYFDANAYHPVRDALYWRDQAKAQIVRGLCKFSRLRSRALFIDSDYGRLQMTQVDPATAGKWVVTPCGVRDVGPGPLNAPAWAQRLSGRPFILYAGAFSENKNQRRLIEAWDQMRLRHPRFPHLVLIGPAPSEYLRKVIEPALARSAFPAEIILPGFVSQADVDWALGTAHAYIQPSFAEGFGMPLIEAMQCDLPVACSNSTSLPEVAGGAAVLFDPSTVESIAQALETIVFDEAERDRLRKAGLERAKAFTWERNAEIVAGRIREELRRNDRG